MFRVVRHRLEWLLLLGVHGFVQVVPGRISLPLLRGIGVLAWLVMGSRRRRAADAVHRCLGPPPGDARNRAIVRGAFVTMCLQLAEPTLLERALRGDPRNVHLTIEGAEHLQRCLDERRGALVATAHFGAWECIAVVLKERFRPVWAVARPPENPYIAAWMDARRARVLRGSLDKDGSAMKMARLMRDGEIVGLLLDQNAGHQGVLLDFLGRPSWHHKVSGIMARRFGAAVLPTYMRREPGTLRFTLVFEAPIEPDPSAGDAEAVEVDIVRRLSASLEGWVRRTPEQWLWLHDRWWRAERALARGEVRRADDGHGPGNERRDTASVPVAEGTTEA